MTTPRYEALDKLQSLDDYMRAEEEFQINKRLREAQIAKMMNPKLSGSSPAAIQIADELAKARTGGNMQRIKDILAAGKIYDRGLTLDDTGNVVTVDGYGDALGQIHGAKAGAEQNAKNQSDLGYKPRIESAVTKAKNVSEKTSELNERIAQFPQLVSSVNKLSELGKKATYTTAGRVYDAARKEMGFDPRESAVARTEYMSLVDNQVLPLLRQTFGAQFTQKEGESLRVTLGDPNKTPEEKDAVLRSFIDQKMQTIQSLGREIGQTVNEDDLVSAFDDAGQDPISPASPELKSLYDRSEAEFNARKANPAIERTLEAAREAIRKGKSRSAVEQRLRDNGIDPGML